MTSDQELSAKIEEHSSGTAKVSVNGGTYWKTI